MTAVDPVDAAAAVEEIVVGTAVEDVVAVTGGDEIDAITGVGEREVLEVVAIDIVVSGDDKTGVIARRQRTAADAPADPVVVVIGDDQAVASASADR